VAEVGENVDADQIYRITFDGSVADEHGFAAIGGQADQVATALKDRYSADMSLTDALSAALTALSAPTSAAGNGAASGNGAEQPEMAAGQLEVAVLDRTRTHRTFRRLAGTRLEELLAESRPAGTGATTGTTASAGPDADAIGPTAPDDGNPTPGTSTDPD
jgi:proteasome alpha subunit